MNEVNIRDRGDVIWAVISRMDSTCDSMLIVSTPIDYPDFASAVSGLVSKMDMDATSKCPDVSSRECDRNMQMTRDVTARIDQVWQTSGL